jgi:hypothetical protein
MTLPTKGRIGYRFGYNEESEGASPEVGQHAHKASSEKWPGNAEANNKTKSAVRPKYLTDD